MKRNSKINVNSLLIKGQNNLLRDSLKKFLGHGLLKEEDKRPSEVKSMVIKDALNAIVLRN